MALKAVDPHGREVYTWVWPTGRRLSIVTQTGVASGAEEADAITLTGGDTTARISKATGELLSVTAKGKTFALRNGPRPAVGEARLTAIAHRQEGYEHVVTAKYTGGLASVAWRINGAGWLRLEYAYEAAGPQLFLGVSFDCPEAKMKTLKWLGEGPYRVWKNRPQGTTLGVWQNVYNDTETGKKTWIYPEFHGYFAKVRWAKLTTDDGPITMVMDQDDLFLRVLGKPGAKTSGRASGQNEVYPTGGLSLIHAIPAIGSKNFGPERSGPSGQRTEAAGKYTGAVSFRFGE